MFKEVEVQGENPNKWYLMRILPYRTIENMIDGLVITFVDVTRIKLLQQNEQRLTKALERSPVSVFGVDADLRFMWACGEVFGTGPRTVLGKAFDETFEEDQAGVKDLALRALASGMAMREQLATKLRGLAHRYDVYVEPSRGTNGRADLTCVAIQLPNGS